VDVSRFPPDQLLRYAQDLAQFRRDGRNLRRRIEERHAGLRFVLIVDDESLMRALISATLSPESYKVIEAADGTTALHMIREHRPTLVILDQRIPAPDGFTVCKAVKQDPELRATLVIMLTGFPSDEPLATAAGADVYLSKPFSPRRLLEIVDALLPLEAGEEQGSPGKGPRDGPPGAGTTGW